MQIVHVATGMETRMGGPPRVVAGLADALQGMGLAQRIMTTYEPGSASPELATACGVSRFARRAPRAWYAARELAQGLASASADVFHLHEVWSYPQFVAARTAKARQAPHVLTPHGELGPNHLRHKGTLHYLKKQLYLRTLGRNVLLGADCVHVFSSREAAGVRAVGYRGPITIVPNGVNLREFERLPPPNAADVRWPTLRNRRVVLFMARLSPEKGLSELLPAWRDLTSVRAFSDALLVLAGPCDRGYSDVVRAMIDRLGIARRVLLTGMVTGEDRLCLLSRADLYTLPSFGEGFSMSLLEAMACGTPAIYTTGCNFPEAAAAGAGFCVAPRADRLADALRRGLEMSPRERAAAAASARQLVRREYTWEAVAGKLATVYEAIVAGKPLPLKPHAWSGPLRDRRAA